MSDKTSPSRRGATLSRRNALLVLGAGLTQAVTGASAQPVGTKRVSVRDFGARGDGRTDDSNAISAAIAALDSGGIVEFPSGHYFLGREINIVERLDITFLGDEATISGTELRSYLNFLRCERIRISKLTFDTNCQKLPLYRDFADGPRQVAIRYFEGFDLNVDNCHFVNLYTAHIVFHNATGMTVSYCDFLSPLQNQDQYLSFVEILSVDGRIDVSHNRFLGSATTRNDRSPSAVAASGIKGSLRIADNRAEHCGRNNAGTHRLGVFDIYADAVNVEVANNVAIDCREQFMRLSTTVDATVHHNVVSVAAEADLGYSTLSLESGSFPDVLQPVCRRISIHCNQFTDPRNRQAYAVGVLAYDWGAANQAVRVVNNRIEGYETAIVVVGPFSDLRIEDNRARDVGAFITQSLVGTVPLTSIVGRETNAPYDGLEIANNTVEIRPRSPLIPISLSTHRAQPFRGTVGTFAVRGNKIIGSDPAAQFAISAIDASARLQGKLVAEDNEIVGYRTGFYLRTLGSVRLNRNATAGSEPIYATDGQVEIVENVANSQVRDLATRLASSLADGSTALTCPYD